MRLKNIFLLIFLTLLSCSETKDINLETCNECVIVDNNLYKITKTDNYTIIDVVLKDDLLTVKIGASGCNSESWKSTLVDANQVLESHPIQRNSKLLFENNEACLAYFEKEFTFNIKKLKENQTEIILNLEGWNTQINYK